MDPVARIDSLDSLNRLARLIRDGAFGEVEALAQTLARRPKSTEPWRGEAPDEVVLFWFDAHPRHGHNRRLRKWVGALNRLMRKLVAGEFHEVVRVAAIMKKHAHQYTHLLTAQAVPASHFPGAGCGLDSQGGPTDAKRRSLEPARDQSMRRAQGRECHRVGG